METLTLDIMPVEIADYISTFLGDKDLLSFSLTSKYYNDITFYNLNCRHKEYWESKGLNELVKLGDLIGIKYLAEKYKEIITENNVYDIKLACEYGHLEILKYLVSKGADITINDDEILILASENGHLEVVKYLYSLGIVDITAYDNEAVRWASRNGHLETVKYLVSLGADITVYNNQAVRWAKQNKHLDVVEYLESILLTKQ